MGDWERTYGAGVDAADVIDGYAFEGQRKPETPPVFIPPDGMPNIEKALFEKLSEHTRTMEENYGLPYGGVITDWRLLKIVAALPDTEDSMKAMIGHNIDYMHEFLVASRDAREHRFQDYLKYRKRERDRFVRSQTTDDDGEASF